MRKFIFPVLCTIVLATGCGRDKVLPTGDKNSPTVKEGRKVTLVVFGAGYCEVCKSKFPEVDQLLKDFSKDTRSRVNVQLYVTSGAPASVRPTQDLADAYKAHYLPTADKTQADPWR